MDKKIKAVIFDLDDTLYDYKSLNELAEKEIQEHVKNKYNIDAQDFNKNYYEAKEIVKSRLRGTGAEHNRLLYFQVFMELIGKKPASDAIELYDIYWNTILDNIVLRDGVKDIFSFCHNNNISIGICSDLTAMIQHRKLKRLGIDSQVDYLVTSEEAGVEKPNPIIFETLLSKIGCDTSECMFIGDSRNKDVCGSKDIGMIPVWFNIATESQCNVIQISDFYELEPILRKYI